MTTTTRRSVWIDYCNGQTTPQVDRLDQLLGTQPLAVGDLILVEVLQGFRHDADCAIAKQLLIGRRTTFCAIGSVTLRCSGEGRKAQLFIG